MAPYQSSTLPNLSWYFFQRRIILTLCLTNASTATYGPLVGGHLRPLGWTKVARIYPSSSTSCHGGSLVCEL